LHRLQFEMILNDTVYEAGRWIELAQGRVRWLAMVFVILKRSIKQYFSGDKTENWMGGTCSIYGGEERRIQGFGGEP